MFNRRAIATLYRPTAGDPFFTVDGSNAIQIKDLHMAFSIVKDLDSKPNKSEITIYNLNEDSRNAFAKKPLQVKIEAGYVDNLKQIFVGDLRFAHSTLNAATWATKIELGDGDRAFQHARVNRSFKGGTSGTAALADVAGAMGLKVPSNLADAKELIGVLVSGGNLNGRAATHMTSLTRKANLSWSIQDSNLQILRVDEAIGTATDAFELSAAFGMIGSPEYGSPGSKGEAPTCTIKMYLYPQLSPGRLAVVKSRATSGLFRIEKVTHSGDTRGGDWYTSAEVKQV